MAGLALGYEGLPPPHERTPGLCDVEDVTHLTLVDLLQLLYHQERFSQQHRTKREVRQTQSIASTFTAPTRVPPEPKTK